MCRVPRPSARAAGLAGGQLDRGDVAPELLEAVVGPRLRREDVEDDVEVVGENPGRLPLAGHVARDEPLLALERLVDLLVRSAFVCRGLCPPQMTK